MAFVAGGILAMAAGYGLSLRARGVEVVDFANEINLGGDPRFEWRSVDKKHWQAVAMNGGVAAEGEPTEVTDAREATGAGCPAGMVRVKGSYRLDRGGDGSGDVERTQDAACTEWVNRDFPARCQTFDRKKIERDAADRKTKALDYCIDRFEYPNVAGQNPMIVVTFNEAAALCKQSKKRLCSESEWTFACEGEEERPYPYGFERDATACVVDRAWRPFNEGAMSPRSGTRAREEVDRLWQGEPSGSRNGCRSPFGVYDMTGNVDEWTRSVRTTGYASVLKGGYWGPVRARCRPATRAHNEEFVAYQQGFRCCAESDASVPAPTTPSTPNVQVSFEAGSPHLDGDADVDASRGMDPAPELMVSSRPIDVTTLPDDRADDDEMKALARARTGLLRCDVVSAPSTHRGTSRSSSVVVGTLILGFVVVRARRRPR